MENEQITKLQEEAFDRGIKRAWEVVVDEFEELMLHFHKEAHDGQNILKTQERIASRLKQTNP